MVYKNFPNYSIIGAPNINPGVSHGKTNNPHPHFNEESIEVKKPAKEEPKFEDVPIEVEIKKPEEYKEVTGAFGVNFGETTEIIKSNGMDPSQSKVKDTAYYFKPTKPYKVFSKYMVTVTPKGREVYGVSAAGIVSSMTDCSNELKNLEKILTKKYGRVSNKSSSFILINQAKAGIRVRCNVNKKFKDELSISYLHFKLQDQARIEKEKVEKKLKAKKEKKENDTSGL